MLAESLMGRPLGGYGVSPPRLQVGWRRHSPSSCFCHDGRGWLLPFVLWDKLTPKRGCQQGCPEGACASPRVLDRFGCAIECQHRRIDGLGLNLLQRPSDTWNENRPQILARDSLPRRPESQGVDLAPRLWRIDHPHQPSRNRTILSHSDYRDIDRGRTCHRVSREQACPSKEIWHPRDQHVVRFQRLATQPLELVPAHISS